MRPGAQSGRGGPLVPTACHGPSSFAAHPLAARPRKVIVSVPFPSAPALPASVAVPALDAYPALLPATPSGSAIARRPFESRMFIPGVPNLPIQPRPGLSSDPQWFRTAVFYEALLRSFADSDGDGVGDFRGLASRLDYLAWLGVNALWIPPFYPSPMRDGGYDISDYTGIDPRYGTMEDFRDLVHQAHERGIRVVIELKRDAMSDIVLNNLFKSTTMESTFGVIMLAINNKEPKVFNLIELLKLFLNHRKTVIIRRTIFDLEKARARAHILEGLKIALDNIDEVIELIKNSADTPSAREGLVAKFGLSELQANAILDMRLSKLTGLEREN